MYRYSQRQSQTDRRRQPAGRGQYSERELCGRAGC